MENKMKKTIALGAVIMLCAVAVIGVGYAAFNGNARTYNDGNSASSGYITVTPNGEGEAQWTQISNNAVDEFSTYVYNSSGTKTAYQLIGAEAQTVTVGSTAGYVVKSLGTAKAFTVTNKTAAAITSAKIAIKQSANVGVSEIVYIVKVNDEYKAFQTTGDTMNALEFTVSDFAAAEGVNPLAVDGTYEFTVGLYIGYLPDVTIPANGIGPATSTANNDAVESTDAPANLSNFGISIAFIDTTS